ncbi:sigma-70 family RNA polymerase sigma factor [Streptomyces sp. C10-9-1]|uniref:sigma-70 family RNA polymerase sigma factor n=1 Tax=Streptomyces sp. C10-9-1 TaxID=1859285 RepID=UPI0021114BA3|nr:sigma-70 family RNA polymerase sigma factor [Streptomyces sp. C10-9-1]MCQ6554918.1 sigma-70 family RNA polymerase sigma factor [Streptomyces sp. C10-9-1]
MTPALPAPCRPDSRGPSRHTPESDAEATGLALRARDGDPVGADRFVRAFQHDVRRYVTHLSADPQAADDLTQDVFVRALASLPRFEGRSSARTWLLTIARRTVVDSIRRAAARPRLSDRDWQAAAERSRPPGVPGFEEGVALAELLALLPAERREAFLLTQVLGLGYAEAASAVGCPVGTIRSRVSRARRQLAGLLADTDPEAAPGARPAPGNRPAPLPHRAGGAVRGHGASAGCQRDASGTAAER